MAAGEPVDVSEPGHDTLLTELPVPPIPVEPAVVTAIPEPADSLFVAQQPSPTPVSKPATRRGRRVQRVVRRIELWSVLKLSLVLYTCLYLAVLVTVAVLWGLAYSTGQIDNLQRFFADVGLENYRFYGDQMFRALAAIGVVGVLAGTVVTVLAAALVNIISEITGGIRLVVIEEDLTPR